MSNIVAIGNRVTIDGENKQTIVWDSVKDTRITFRWVENHLPHAGKNSKQFPTKRISERHNNT